MNWKKIFEWTHRIVAFIIFDGFITIISFVVLVYSIDYFTMKDLWGWEIAISLLNFTLATLYLRVANFLYWICNINMFDFKFWRNSNEHKKSTRTKRR